MDLDRRAAVAAASPEAASPPRVVLVDPDESSRAVLGQALRDGGCDVRVAPNQAQGLVAAHQHQPTVIVTELYRATVLTPRLYVDGLRRHAPGAVVVARTGSAPTAAEATLWDLWAAVTTATPVRELIRLVRAAHQAQHAGNAGWRAGR